MLTRNLTDFLIDIFVMDYVIEFYNCNRTFLCTWRIKGATPLLDVNMLIRKAMGSYHLRGLARVTCIADAEKMSFVVFV